MSIPLLLYKQNCPNIGWILYGLAIGNVLAIVDLMFASISLISDYLWHLQVEMGPYIIILSRYWYFSDCGIFNLKSQYCLAKYTIILEIYNIFLFFTNIEDILIPYVSVSTVGGFSKHGYTKKPFSTWKHHM